MTHYATRRWRTERTKSGSGCSGTPSWARRTRARSARSRGSTRRCSRGSSAIAGRNERGGRGGGRPLRLRALDDRLARPRLRPGRSASSTTAARTRSTPSRRSPRPRRASTSSARSRSAATRRRATRSGRRVAGDRRQAPVRLQLPLRAGRAACARADRGRRAGRDPPLPRPLPAGLGRRPELDTWRFQPRRGRLRRARRPRHARRRPGAVPRRRDRDRSPASCTPSSARAAASTTRFEAAVEFESGADRDDRGDAARARPAERVPVGDQRLEGLARVRHGAAERAAGLPRRRRPRARLQDGARLRDRPSVLGALVAARPHRRLGRHLHARAAPPARRDRGRHGRRALRRHVRGRLPRRRGLRRDRPLRRDRQRASPSSTA